MRLLVLKIHELDCGCEERPDNYEKFSFDPVIYM